MTKQEAREFLLRLSEELWLTDTVRNTLQDIAGLICLDKFDPCELEDPFCAGCDFREGPELLPGEPDFCDGNGQHPAYECCCDNCDYFLDCFPETDVAEAPSP